jgi:chorismate synthase
MNSFGRLFRVHIFGESHGKDLGVVIDGCPAGIPLKRGDFLPDLQRRRGGGHGTTARQEADLPHIRSGVFRGAATGAPILIGFRNRDVRSAGYAAVGVVPRPGHADWVAGVKFGGFQDPRGGGHFSGRLTLGLVAAGVIARKMIYPTQVEAQLLEAGGSCDIRGAVDRALAGGDSIGGIVECRADPVPAGLGEPFFDAAEALISHLVFSIPAVRGIEFGSGFAAAAMCGSRHNDPLVDADGRTLTQHAGGVNGGITNGNPLRFRVAVKPTPSISRQQKSLNLKTDEMEMLEIRGRHDACIALRMPVIVEAATAIVLADLSLLGQRLPRIVSKKTTRR